VLIVLVPVCVILIQTKLRASDNTITVNNLSDPVDIDGKPITSGNGFCTLREGIDNANSPGTDTTGGDCSVGSGTDTINFSVSGTITLGTNGLPEIQNTLTIDGSGQTITIDGASLYNVLVMNSGATLALNKLTIANGNQQDGFGGGLLNIGGALTVTNSTFSGNTAGDGGGIYNAGNLTVTNSTFSGNSATASGGGIFNIGGTLTVTNSTFSGNSAPSGGGIYNSNSGPAATVTNSILAASTGGNCGGNAIVNGGFNISDDANCSFGTSTGANGTIIGDNVNPQLSASGLANNGGPTQTIALQPNSPAIDGIPIAQCPSTDQRGDPRPDPADSGASNLSCDIGALEV
jgi:predicted outer membrane repeat protein